MGIRAEHLRLYVIQPALIYLGLWSEEAESITLGTACVESDCGYNLVQVPQGPGHGIWQIEPPTLADVLKRTQDKYLAIFLRLKDFINPAFNYESQLIGNLPFAAAVCRLKYYLDPAPLPAASDIQGQGEYWSRVYNTRMPPERYMKAYRKYISP